MDLVSEAQKSAVLAVLIDYLLNENISSLDEDIKKLDYECEQYRIAEELRQLISNSKPGRGYVTGEKHKRDDSIPKNIDLVIHIDIFRRRCREQFTLNNLSVLSQPLTGVNKNEKFINETLHQNLLTNKKGAYNPGNLSGIGIEDPEPSSWN